MASIVAYGCAAEIGDVLMGAAGRELSVEEGRHVKGFIINAGLPRSDFGQTVYFLNEIQKSDIERFAFAVENISSGVVDQKTCIDVFLSFKLRSFDVINPKNLLRKLDEAFLAWDERQSQEMKRMIRAHPVSEFTCFKAAKGVVYAKIKFTKERMVGNVICSLLPVAGYAP